MICGILVDPDLHQRDRSISPVRKTSCPLKRNGSTSSIRTRSRDDSVSEEEIRRKAEPRPVSNRGDILMTPLFILPTVTGAGETGKLAPNLPISSDQFSQKRKNIGEQLAQNQAKLGHRKTKSDDIDVAVVSLNFLNHSYYLLLHYIKIDMFELCQAHQIIFCMFS